MRLVSSYASLTSLSSSSISECRSPINNTSNQYEWEMVNENFIIELFNQIKERCESLGWPILDKCNVTTFMNFAYISSNIYLIENSASPNFLEDYDTEESIED